jgi:septum site-determining protein MinC
VRSGQQIYAKGCDLIVLGPISQGAELLSDGHIHVYGPLRGRALAGINGNKEAHIFCHSLEAELISIAGHYKLSEDIEKIAWRVNVDISLINEQLDIRLL